MPHAPALAGPAEAARRRLVRGVLAIYLLAIVEGSIRKYIAPQLGQYIFFIRDPIVLWVYLLAFRHGLWPRRDGWLDLAWLACAVGALLFVLQSALGGFSETRLLLGVYGWRSYFLYIPLAFLIGAQFRPADLLLLARLTLLLALPVAVLVAAQAASPIHAPINVGIAEERELQFQGMGLNAERVRATGPFTSGVGLQQFVATASAFVLALALMPAARRRFGLFGLLGASAAILTSIALSGSRGTLLQCVMITCFALGLSIVGRGAGLKSKALVLPVLLVVGSAALYPIVFPAGFAAFVDRWTVAASAESGFQGGVLGRALFGFVDFFRLVQAVPALGYGLGYGGNASITLRASVDGVMPGTLAETDFARHMVDLGPAFGLLYIALRIGLVLWLGREVLRATRQAADPLPMLLFAYVSYVLLLGQLTGHGSINVYGWLFTGFAIAAARLASAPLGRRATAPAVAGAAGAAGQPGGVMAAPRGAAAVRRAPRELGLGAMAAVRFGRTT